MNKLDTVDMKFKSDKDKTELLQEVKALEKKYNLRGEQLIDADLDIKDKEEENESLDMQILLLCAVVVSLIVWHIMRSF